MRLWSLIESLWSNGFWVPLLKLKFGGSPRVDKPKGKNVSSLTERARSAAELGSKRGKRSKRRRRGKGGPVSRCRSKALRSGKSQGQMR